MGKRKKSEITKLQEKLWDECKRIIRARYGNTCYTCGKTGLEGSNWQTGHMIPKAVLGVNLKYDLRVLRPQCYNCNIHHGGMGAVFIERMRSIEGDGYVDLILSERNAILSSGAKDYYYKLLDEYKKIKK